LWRSDRDGVVDRIAGAGTLLAVGAGEVRKKKAAKEGERGKRRKRTGFAAEENIEDWDE